MTAIFWIEITSTIIIFLAVLVALFKEKFWNWKNKPIIKIGFGNDNPYVVNLYPNPIIRLFRLKIVNQGKTIAKNCHVKLLSVVAEGEDVKSFLIEEPDILKWSSAPRDMRYRDDVQNIQSKDISQLVPIYRETKDITPEGGWEFCDLFEINSNKNVVFASSGKRNFLAEDKNYIATIEISGDSLKPIKKKIKFSIQDKIDPKTFAIYLAKIEGVRDVK